MSTTSLKLSEELKRQAAAAAQDLGMSTHAFMVEAIRQAAAAAEQRQQFLAEARAAHEEMLKTGAGFDAEDVRAYLRKRLTDPETPRPRAKPWAE